MIRWDLLPLKLKSISFIAVLKRGKNNLPVNKGVKRSGY